VLFLLAYRMPGQRLLIIVAITLAVVVMIVGIERAGWWPEGLRTQGLRTFPHTPMSSSLA
jgi:hypothetical protein